jgi:transcriptional regulator with XRE-family HTH domain
MTSQLDRDSWDDFAERFGENLIRHRKRVGLTQEQLSVRASLHRTAVGKLEGGERVARADTLVKLAGALGVRPEDLLEGLKWSPGEVTAGEFRPAARCGFCEAEDPLLRPAPG